jgi:macrolide glycosyltransferase
MAHILMAGVGAHGHTNPHLGVVAELVERGHRVDWIIPAGFAEIVAASGAHPFVVESVTPDESAGEQWPVDPVAGTALFLDELEHVFPQVEHLRPDLVLYDIGGYAGRALAEIHDIPLVQLSPSMVGWDGFADDMGDALAFRQTPGFRAYDARFTAWLTSHGIDLTPDDFTGVPPRGLVLIPRAMQPFAEKVDPRRFTFVGPSLDRRGGEWPASDMRTVLVSLGSNYTDHPAFYRACAEAFAPLGWRVVIAHGHHVTPDDLGPLPAGVELHRWVPQFAVLGRASLFVTHAGMGGCAEGLYQGVPMIAAPQAVDQFGNAATLVELGVGVQVPTEATVDELRAALAVVDTDAVRARAAELAARTRAEGGARAAADHVEALLPR